MLIFTIVVLVIFLILVLYDKKGKKIETEPSSYKGCYKARYLLTKNEYAEYKKLKLLLEEKGYMIFPKVRLFDIIEPISNQKNYKTLMYKIQSKHVDFLICDSDLYIKAIVEIDDKSHDTKSRSERDSFVDEILQDVGYPVIRTRYVDDTIMEKIP